MFHHTSNAPRSRLMATDQGHELEVTRWPDGYIEIRSFVDDQLIRLNERQMNFVMDSVHSFNEIYS